MNVEDSIMELIVSAGQARSCAMEAMGYARNKAFDQAEKSMRQAREAVKDAHHVQTSLIEQDQGEGKIPVTLVMVHAQDHLMTAMLCIELAEEIIQLHRVNNSPKHS